MCAWRVAEKKKQRDGMGEEDGRRTVRVQWSCDKDKSAYAKIIVNCAIITVLCNHYLHMKIYYLNKELKKLQSKEDKESCH